MCHLLFLTTLLLFSCCIGQKINATLTWKQVDQTLPTNIWYHSTAIWNERFYIFGGNDNVDKTKRIYSIPISSLLETSVSNPLLWTDHGIWKYDNTYGNITLHAIFGVQIFNLFYFLSYFDAYELRLLIYNLDTNEQISGSSYSYLAPQHVYYGGCIITNNNMDKIYIFGGSIGVSNPTNTIQVYDMINDEWYINPNDTTLNVNRSSASCVYSETYNNVYIIGGVINGTEPSLTSIEIYDIDTSIMYFIEVDSVPGIPNIYNNGIAGNISYINSFTLQYQSQTILYSNDIDIDDSVNRNEFIIIMDGTLALGNNEFKTINDTKIFMIDGNYENGTVLEYINETRITTDTHIGRAAYSMVKYNESMYIASGGIDWFKVGSDNIFTYYDTIECVTIDISEDIDISSTTTTSTTTTRSAQTTSFTPQTTDTDEDDTTTSTVGTTLSQDNTADNNSAAIIISTEDTSGSNGNNNNNNNNNNNGLSDDEYLAIIIILIIIIVLFAICIFGGIPFLLSKFEKKLKMYQEIASKSNNKNRTGTMIPMTAGGPAITSAFNVENQENFNIVSDNDNDNDNDNTAQNSGNVIGFPLSGVNYNVTKQKSTNLELLDDYVKSIVNEDDVDKLNENESDDKVIGEIARTITQDGLIGRGITESHDMHDLEDMYNNVKSQETKSGKGFETTSLSSRGKKLKTKGRTRKTPKNQNVDIFDDEKDGDEIVQTDDKTVEGE